jgi:putative SOS response-associated peptidase YedK
MCRRYSITADVETVRLLFDVAWDGPWIPRHNISATQMAPVVRVRDGARELTMLLWGLIPSWAEDLSAAGTRINVPAETIAALPSFREAFKARRCLVIASGFFQWRRGGNSMPPYWIGFKDRRPFSLAGLWENWEDRSSGVRIESFAIITTTANALVAPIHHRMPAIIDAAHFDLWLNAPSVPPEFLRPYPAHSMDAYPVSTWVNRRAHDDPRCTEPLLH